MTPELQEALYKDFPDLFREKDLPMTQTCMCWGCEVGDGWEPILRKVCEDLTALDLPHLRLTQVKEKYGTLTIYVNDYQDEVEDILGKAEIASSKTCEECGKPGTINSRGYLQCLCDECRLCMGAGRTVEGGSGISIYELMFGSLKEGDNE